MNIETLLLIVMAFSSIFAIYGVWITGLYLIKKNAKEQALLSDEEKAELQASGF